MLSDPRIGLRDLPELSAPKHTALPPELVEQFNCILLCSCVFQPHVLATMSLGSVVAGGAVGYVHVIVVLLLENC